MAKSRTEKTDGVVILGCPRSGTTLLRRILGAHPNFDAPGETNLLTACARFLKSENVTDGMQVGVINGLGFLGVEEGEIVSKLRDMAFSFRRDRALSLGKSRWVEKTAVDVFHIDEIARLCGDEVQYVCMTRHGLDVACSMVEWCEKAGAYPSELHEYVRQYARPLEAFCHAWVDASKALRALADAHPDNATSIRYEDLLADPVDLTRSVFAFLKEDWSEDLLTKAFEKQEAEGFSDWKTFATNSLQKTSVDRWRRLSKATLAGLAPIVNPTLEAWGYSVVDVPATDSDSKARRRYEMGLALQKEKP